MDCGPNRKNIKVHFQIFRHYINTLSGIFGARKDSDSQICFNQQEGITHGKCSFSLHCSWERDFSETDPLHVKNNFSVNESSFSLDHS